MKLAILLLEYQRSITELKLGDKLVAAAQRDRKQPLGVILNTLEKIDPTNHKQYVEWLCRQYIAGTFRLEDANRVNTTLARFEQVKRRLPQQQRDINKFTFYTLDELIDQHFNIELGSHP